MALVGNKSAVGEQYVELQPQTDGGPYLQDGSEIDTPQTKVPVSTTEILTNLSNLVESVPQADLRTVVAEFGRGLQGRRPQHRADHRHLDLVHRHRERQLRDHHRT